MNRRNTVQRKLVLEAVRGLKNHATAEAVYEYIVKENPSVGKGTVYRNLNLLAECGDVKKVCIADGPDRFDHNCHEHYHVLCVNCGRVWDVDMDVIPDIWDRIRHHNGMEFIGYDILFKGVCEDCRNK